MATAALPIYNPYGPSANPYTQPVDPNDPNNPQNQVPALPQFNPNNPSNASSQNMYGVPWGPYSSASTGDQQSTMGFSPSTANVDVAPNDPMENIFAANRNNINDVGNTIGNEAGSTLPYYSDLQQSTQSAEDAALNQLQQTPGFTTQEASAITGDPNAAVQTMTEGSADAGAMLNQYQSELGSQLGKMDTNLTAAQSDFAPMNTAVNNSALGFDPNGTEKQMTNQDVQNLVTQAGTTVGNQYQAAEDQMMQQAAAAGNTSPAALAAMRQQLLTQEGTTAGDAMTNAQISANNAQYQRAAGIEQQREGAVQTQTGLQATAATTEEAAAQAAAQSEGQTAVQGVTNYGQFSTGEQLTAAQEQAQTQQTADTQASQRAQTIGQQRIAGQGQYMSGVAGQQSLAQQGGQAAISEQEGAYGTQSSGLNASTNSMGNFEVGKASAGDTALHSVATLFGEGGVATEPTDAIIGERGPEMVVPMGRYRSRVKRERMAA